jgi:hypothetical protein
MTGKLVRLKTARHPDQQVFDRNSQPALHLA